jgi:hypothetical protein
MKNKKPQVFEIKDNGVGLMYQTQMRGNGNGQYDNKEPEDQAGPSLSIKDHPEKEDRAGPNW